MKITQARKRLVLNEDFAWIVKGLIGEFITRGMSDEESMKRAATMIAWAAVGGDILQNPTDSELIQLQRFCSDHGEEIDALTLTCLKNAFRETVH